jgi:hypothetical protein
MGQAMALPIKGVTYYWVSKMFFFYPPSGSIKKLKNVL